MKEIDELRDFHDEMQRKIGENEQNCYLRAIKTGMIKLKDIKAGWIIHVFALLHAVVTLTCRYAGLNDELLLTVLTMTMVLLICMKKWISIEFAAACVIVANVFGYMMGHFGAELLQPLIGTNPAANAVATVLTTEFLGWTIVGITRLFRHREKEETEISLLSPQMQWLLAAVGIIFALRIGIVILLNSAPLGTSEILSAITRIFSNSASLMIMIALNLLYIRWYDSTLREKLSYFVRPVVLLGIMVTITLLEIMLIGYRSPSGLASAFTSEFPVLFVTTLLAEVSVYCIVYMINYALKARTEAKEAKGMANIAEYRYFKLKHQVNPHFLFNSLNILDCLVCEEKTEQASTYIHKLAGLYRYMLKTEEEKLVTLEEELNFASQYYDLLKVRFPEGLRMEVSVPEELKSRYMVPCALQLLIENATKHNAVTASNPLTIKIMAEGDKVTVCNALIPKVSQSPSTGLGLKYMKQQYLDISGKTVDIEKTDERFCVTIPLL